MKIPSYQELLLTLYKMSLTKTIWNQINKLRHQHIEHCDAKVAESKKTAKCARKDAKVENPSYFEYN